MHITWNKNSQRVIFTFHCKIAITYPVIEPMYRIMFIMGVISCIFNVYSYYCWVFFLLIDYIVYQSSDAEQIFLPLLYPISASSHLHRFWLRFDLFRSIRNTNVIYRSYTIIKWLEKSMLIRCRQLLQMVRNINYILWNTYITWLQLSIIQLSLNEPSYWEKKKIPCECISHMIIHRTMP